ncbi:hypothetical protein TWF594_000688 [Orbilia oligospora]|nr:hypothetical protein TWF594_000688 [Orbilia oligospora]
MESRESKGQFRPSQSPQPKTLLYWKTMTERIKNGARRAKLMKDQPRVEKLTQNWTAKKQKSQSGVIQKQLHSKFQMVGVPETYLSTIKQKTDNNITAEIQKPTASTAPKNQNGAEAPKTLRLKNIPLQCKIRALEYHDICKEVTDLSGIRMCCAYGKPIDPTQPATPYLAIRPFNENPYAAVMCFNIYPEAIKDIIFDVEKCVVMVNYDPNKCEKMMPIALAQNPDLTKIFANILRSSNLQIYLDSPAPILRRAVVEFLDVLPIKEEFEAEAATIKERLGGRVGLTPNFDNSSSAGEFTLIPRASETRKRREEFTIDGLMNALNEETLIGFQSLVWVNSPVGIGETINGELENSTMFKNLDRFQQMAFRHILHEETTAGDIELVSGPAVENIFTACIKILGHDTAGFNILFLQSKFARLTLKEQNRHVADLINPFTMRSKIKDRGGKPEGISWTNFKAQILSEQTIVFTTIDLMYLTRPYWKDFSPKMLILDEAAATTGPNSLLAWVVFRQSIGRFVLMGDQAQLKPYSISGDGQMLTSLSERLTMSGWPTANLQMNHRMTEDVSAPVTIAFYPNRDCLAGFGKKVTSRAHR